MTTSWEKYQRLGRRLEETRHLRIKYPALTDAELSEFASSAEEHVYAEGSVPAVAFWNFVCRMHPFRSKAIWREIMIRGNVKQIRMGREKPWVRA